MTPKEEGENCRGSNNHGDSEMLDDDQHMESSLIHSGSSGDSGGIDGGDSDHGIRKHDNRLGGGAGKRLMYKDLQVGLKTEPYTGPVILKYDCLVYRVNCLLRQRSTRILF